WRARAGKAAITRLAVFMALDQLETAQDVVLVFFVAVVGAAALAAGIAFGLGGREVSAEITREWYARNRWRPPVCHDERSRSAPVPPAEPMPPAPPPTDQRE